MMFKGKRILAFILMVFMLLSLLPAVALAEDSLYDATISTEGLTNLVSGGDFEVDVEVGKNIPVTVGSTEKSWEVKSASYGTKGSVTTDAYRSEGKSVKIADDSTKEGSTPANSKWLLLKLPVSEFTLGHTYRFIVYSLKGDDDAVPVMRIDFKHSDDNTGKYIGQADGIAEGNGWVKHTFDFTVPETACSAMNIYLYNQNAVDTSVCYFDDFAIYDLDEELYTVTWKNYDGTVLETDTNVAAGVTPEYNGTTPAKASSNGFSYFFSGWSPEVTAVTGDVTYTAQFASMKNIAADDFDGTDGLSWNGFAKKAAFSTEQKRSGSQSAKITYGGTSATSKWISHTLSVEAGDLVPGHTYRFVAYSKMGDANSLPQMRIVATHTTTKKYDDNTDTEGTAVSNEWVKLEMKYEAPDDTESIVVYLRNYSATDGSYCYFDDFAVYDLSAETPAEFSGSNITMGSDLKLNFYFDTAKVESTGYAVIAREGYEDTTVQLATCGKDASGNYYKIPYAGLNAKEMGDTLSVTVYNAEGTAVSETYSDSIRTYCERNIGKTAAELGIADAKLDAFRTLMVDMLNYGAAAQIKANYKTDALANAGLSAEQKGYGTQTDPTYTSERTVTGNTDAYYGTSFNMENEISMNLYVLTSAIEGGKAVVTFKDHYGNDKEQTINAADCTTKGAYTCFTVTAIVAADGRQPITCEFYAADATDPVVVVTDSMESYVGRMVGEYEWLNEVMKFSDAAKAYLH